MSITQAFPRGIPQNISVQCVHNDQFNACLLVFTSVHFSSVGFREAINLWNHLPQFTEHAHSCGLFFFIDHFTTSSPNSHLTNKLTLLCSQVLMLQFFCLCICNEYRKKYCLAFCDSKNLFITNPKNYSRPMFGIRDSHTIWPLTIHKPKIISSLIQNSSNLDFFSYTSVVKFSSSN